MATLQNKVDRENSFTFLTLQLQKDFAVVRKPGEKILRHMNASVRLSTELCKNNETDRLADHSTVVRPDPTCHCIIY